MADFNAIVSTFLLTFLLTVLGGLLLVVFVALLLGAIKDRHFVNPIRKNQKKINIVGPKFRRGGGKGSRKKGN